MSEPGSRPGPFLRWAGGKRQLLPTLLGSLPKDLADGRFYEPFIGGGALMFALAETVPGSKIVINDANEDLIAAYTAVRDTPEQLLAELLKLSKDTSSDKYYEVRDKLVPANDLEKAARFIYLNKTCFNGLWRVNSKGKFNVPYGKLAKPTIIDEALLKENSARLRGAIIRCGSYTAAVSDAQSGDVVYFDPPYIPLNSTSSFSKYAKEDFGDLDQWALGGVIKGLVERGVRVMLSNSDTELSRKIFGGTLELRQVSATRSISAAADSREKVMEILGFSYPTKGLTAASLRKVAKRN